MNILKFTIDGRSLGRRKSDDITIQVRAPNILEPVHSSLQKVFGFVDHEPFACHVESTKEEDILR